MRFKAALVAAAALVALGGVAALAVRETGRAAAKMQPSTVSAAVLRAAPPGARAKLMLRLTRAQGAHLEGALLEKRGSAYGDAGAQVHVELSADTGVVMGQAADLKPGAVVEVSGAFDGQRVLHARQVVILTGYVRLSSDGAAR